MRVAVIRANEMSEELVARWSEIQRNSPSLFSPYFRPEFTQAMASVRNDVFAAIVDDGAAFFPFQRNFIGQGRPVGGQLSDYHGLIAPSDYRCDLVALIRACKLWKWTFDHVPAEQTMFAPWRTIDAASPVVDLGKGGPRGSTAMHADHKRKKKGLEREKRRLERDFGNVEFELESRDPLTLDLCLKWKSAQYHRTEKPDLFARPWARSLIEAIASQHKPEFSGVLSVLRVGGQPVAAHFGMRSSNVWHYWFPAFDPHFQIYSPGMLLLSEMIAGAPRLGVKTIDFGKGDEDYKLRFATRKVPLMEGAVITSPFISSLHESTSQVRSLVKKSDKMKVILKPVYMAYKKVRKIYRIE
jgi:CelD/BcsL family acetyltransferase involved in cellulose biosynthesis